MVVSSNRVWHMLSSDFDVMTKTAATHCFRCVNVGWWSQLLADYCFHRYTEHSLVFFFFLSLLQYNCAVTTWKGGSRLDSGDIQSHIHFSVEKWAGHAEDRPQYVPGTSVMQTNAAVDRAIIINKQLKQYSQFILFTIVVIMQGVTYRQKCSKVFPH